MNMNYWVRDFIAGLVIMTSLSGCMTVAATFDKTYRPRVPPVEVKVFNQRFKIRYVAPNPFFLQPMAGTRAWISYDLRVASMVWESYHVMGGIGVLVFLDFPLSFALDIALLPVTLPYTFWKSE